MTPWHWIVKTASGFVVALGMAATFAAPPAAPRLSAKPTPFEFQTVAFLSTTTGRNPQEGLVVGQDGMLYGTAPFEGPLDVGPYAGTFFRLNPSDLSLTVLHAFDPSQASGVQPVGRLWPNVDGSFYGVTASGAAGGYGAIYRVTADGLVTTLHAFGTSGLLGPKFPSAGVIQASDGKLYGTTANGGRANSGTLYRLNPDGSGFEVLHEFDGADHHDGVTPAAELVQARDGHLYGTTAFGGPTSDSNPNGWGTIFRWRLSGKYEQVQQLNPVLGTQPMGPLLASIDGRLYGTTASGGPNRDAERWGDVFRLGPVGKHPSYRVVMITGDRAPAPDAASIAAGVIETPDGYLWGTSYWRGVCVERGTVFRTSRNGEKTIVHSFCTADGGNPLSELVLAPDGWLYGTTSQAGGAGFGGTIFRIWPHDQ